MADMILGVDWDITKAEAKQRKLNREFEESQKKADLIGRSIERLKEDLATEERLQKEIKDDLKEQVKEAAALEEKITKVKSGTATIGETMELGSLDAAEAKLKEMEDSIKNGYKELEKSNSRHDKISNKIDKQNLKLTEQNNMTATIGDNVALNSKKQNKFGAALKKSNKPLEQFGKRIRELIKSALIFSVITKALNAMKEALGQYLKQDSKLSGSIAKLKGNLAIIGATLSSTLAPVLQWITDKLVYITSLVGATLARFLGKDVNEMARLAKATKKTADEAKRATGGFDTLQKIDTSNNDSKSDEIGIDTSAMKNINNSDVDIFIQKLKDALGIVGAIGVALAAWKVIDVFNAAGFSKISKVVAGVAFIIEGMIFLNTAVSNWNDELGNGENTLNSILGTIGAILVAVGLIVLGVAAWPVAIAAVLIIIGMWIDNYKDKVDKWLESLPAGIYDIMHLLITTALSAWYTFKEIWRGIKEIFSGEWETGLKRIGIAVLNSLIHALNTLVDFTNLCLYPFRALIAQIGKWSGKEWTIRDVAIPHIPTIDAPKLATGTVIPGGSPFLAWLGDQRKGQTNIEAPLDTIVEAFKTVQSGQTVNVNFTGSLAQLARVLAPEITTENNRASVFAKG